MDSKEQRGGEVMVDDIALDNIRAQQMFIKFGFEHHPSLARTITSVVGTTCFGCGWTGKDSANFMGGAKVVHLQVTGGLARLELKNRNISPIDYNV